MGGGLLAPWFSGLPCSGKTTIALLVGEALAAQGQRVQILDGDRLRRTSSADLGFSPADRTEQARRVAIAARRLLAQGVVPLVAVVTPYRTSRDLARAVLGSAYLEIHVDAPLEVCEARDVKGMYRRAREGELEHFTGVSAPFEPPTAPHLRVDTSRQTPAESAALVVALLAERGALPQDRGDTARYSRDGGTTLPAPRRR